MNIQELLQRTRQIKRIVQAGEHRVAFDDLANTLSACINSRVAIVSLKGKVLARAGIERSGDTAWVSEDLSRAFMKLDEPTEIADVAIDGAAEHEETTLHLQSMTAHPIYGGGQRLGTLLLDGRLDEAEAILACYAATVVGLELMHEQRRETLEESLERETVRIALNNLSYSELEAARHIFAEFDTPEATIVSSHIADRIGVTRSVMVNTIRKLESAGVVQARSLGMKGTRIRVVKPAFIRALQRDNPHSLLRK